LLKNKSQPESAANDAAAWVISEREMRERLRREQDAREAKERLDVSLICTTDINQDHSYFLISARKGARSMPRRRKRKLSWRRRSSSLPASSCSFKRRK